MTGLGADRPMTVVIAAMGGEGGGLLTDWIVEAARRSGHVVQATSIPGVAQRTGATTYYVELMKPAATEVGEPVFGLYPAPGHVDIAVATELVEAGRLIENGFVSPDRTTLVASNHRVYAIAERSAMADGTIDAARIVAAARALSQRAMLDDFARLASERGTALNAILLGAVSGVADMPIAAAAFEDAIVGRGVAVEANLTGFRLGAAYAAGEIDLALVQTEAPAAAAGSPDQLVARARASLPGGVMDIVVAGIDRLVDYQDLDYAALYLDRLAAVHGVDDGDDFELTRETARHLALWMAYEDVIRVADLKSRAARFDRIRRETRARLDQPVRITEFFKPGIDEAATILPAAWGRALRGWAVRKGIRHRLHLPLHLRSDTIFGFLCLRFLARMKRRRRKGLRYRDEQAMIADWLAAIESAAARHNRFACEIAACGQLVKGYSDTRERANRNLTAILTHIVAPNLAAAGDLSAAADRLRSARLAALADDQATALATILEGDQTAGPLPAAAE